MPAATMFSKFKSGNQNPQNPIEANPITQYFEIGKSDRACAGPELVWKIYDAYRKSDGKVSESYLMSIKTLLARGRLSINYSLSLVRRSTLSTRLDRYKIELKESS